MRALFILADNVYLTPYLNFYIDILNKCGFNYDVVYWDKNNNENIVDNNYYRFSILSLNRLDRLFGYFRYKRFVINTINKKEYDLVIPLHMPIYLFINFYLIRNFKNRFIFDIRDYSFERFFVFRFIEKALANNSLINIVSSSGFKSFLPQNEYFVHHNLMNVDYKEYKQYDNPQKPIELSFIGLIRFMDQNKKIINFFKNDDRFHLNFIGTNAEQLDSFCKDNKINNVTLIGTFDSKKTLSFYDKSDGILNIYGNNSKLLEYALSNKLYYSAMLYKPILVSESTYMAQLTDEYQLGKCVNLDDCSQLDVLYDYFTKMNRKEYIKNCDLFISNVVEEQNKTFDEIIKRVNQIKNTK